MSSSAGSTGFSSCLSGLRSIELIEEPFHFGGLTRLIWLRQEARFGAL